MWPVQTSDTNLVYKLPGGTEENDLPCTRVREGFVISEWELSDAERAAISLGARVELGVHGEPHVPVQLSVVIRDDEGNAAYVDEEHERPSRPDRNAETEAVKPEVEVEAVEPTKATHWGDDKREARPFA